MKKAVLIYFFFLSLLCNAQNPQWTFSVDSVANLSSARAADLNNDGIPDIVFGAGKDGAASANGIIAVNGSNGQLLWKRPARNEVFGSAIFQDITADGIPDVFITGRQAQMLAINGANGQLIWDFFPYNSNPADSGYYNFYNPTFVSDFTNDGIEDILVSNGGDHAAPVWVTDRPAVLLCC
jgi:outer membrane protein assembly factor BamB